MRMPWWSGGATRSRRIATIGAIVTCCVLVGGSTAAYAFDRSNAGTLLPGTTIGGVQVGGLTLDRAIDRLREEIEDPLHVPVRVRAPGIDKLARPWDLGLRVQVDAAARRALADGRDGNLFRRVWRRAIGSDDRSMTLRPRLNKRVLDEFIGEVADRVKIPAVDASMHVSGGWVRISPGRVGRELDLKAAQRDLEAAVHKGEEEVTFRTREVQPAVPPSSLATVVLVRTGENRLYLYRDGAIVRSWPVATGSAQFPTPTGTFKVVSKRKNPTWVNPGSDWSRKLPNFIPPGPDNPLGSRAMDLNASNIRIHGTPDAGSIGFSVSHGCIRMTMADAEALFAEVSTGTPVVIAQVAPPRPRPKPTPLPPPPGAAPTQPA